MERTLILTRKEEGEPTRESLTRWSAVDCSVLSVSLEGSRNEFF